MLSRLDFFILEQIDKVLMNIPLYAYSLYGFPIGKMIVFVLASTGVEQFFMAKVKK